MFWTNILQKNKIEFITINFSISFTILETIKEMQFYTMPSWKPLSDFDQILYW
jgi:hypothetical protein